MIKHLSICVALMSLATGSATAQQKEAVLQRMEVPGAAFDMWCTSSAVSSLSGSMIQRRC
jgi:hypothetical protein